MSDDQTIPTEKRAQLTQSITNLWDEFGNTDNLVTGTLLNMAIALPGLAGYVLINNPLKYVALLWAIVHIVAIVQGWIEA